MLICLRVKGRREERKQEQREERRSSGGRGRNRRKAERQRQRQRLPPSMESLSDCTRNLEIHPDLSHGWQRMENSDHPPLLCRKQGSPDSDKGSWGHFQCWPAHSTTIPAPMFCFKGVLLNHCWLRPNPANGHVC